MGLHERYGLTQVVNAHGTYTPLGVSRSDKHVVSLTAEALSEFFVMDELKDLVGRTIRDATGAEDGTVVHCTSAGITLSVAAVMAGDSAPRIAALPNTEGMASTVVLPAGHAVDYGHPVVQDVRLAGATPVLAGSDEECDLADLDAALAAPGVACLLLVSSRMTRGAAVPFADAVAMAHERGLPVIVDGAGQDFRIEELLGTGADLVAVSGQKYLGSPTAGLVLGRADLVRAVRAQEKGIGRAMKPSKEAIFGVIAALEVRASLDRDAWEQGQRDKVARFIARAERIRGLTVGAVPDSVGLPFARVRLTVDAATARLSAAALAEALRYGTPSVWVMTQGQERDDLLLELVPLSDDELELVLARLAELLEGGR